VEVAEAVVAVVAAGADLLLRLNEKAVCGLATRL
jgi:hypothetical protein